MTIISTLRNGAIAGFLATGPMTATMELMFRFLPRRERYPLPPSQITAGLSEAVGLREHTSQEEHAALTLTGHFGYGATAGALYAPIANRVPLPPAIKGIVFGLVVWTVSYLGWLPVTGLLRPATQQPAGRNALMIAAHVVWGAAVGTLTDRLQRRG